MPADRNRLIGRYLSIATKARKIGHSDWHQVRELVEAEGDNLDPICELAVESIISRSDVDGALIGLSEFHRFTGSASVKSLVRAVGRLGGRSPRRVGAYLLHLGAIALCRSDHQTATSRFKTALVFFQKDRDEQGRADCTYSLGTVARNLLQYGTATDRYEEAIKLYRRNFHGKANCIFGLGGIAMRRSDHATALARFSEALALYQDTNDEQGEGNCIQLIGRIALERSDQATAAAKFHEALALFQRIGSAQSAATCILDLGEVATQCSDQESAKIQFDAALALFRHYGNVQAEANCIRRLGIISLRNSDYGSAAARFDASLALYQKSEDQSGVAEALIRRGQARIGAGGIAQGIADIESGFGLYFQIADTEDRAVGGWQALHRALICENPAEAAKHLKKAETLWTLIGRIDLVQDWLTPIP